MDVPVLFATTRPRGFRPAQGRRALRGPMVADPVRVAKGIQPEPAEQGRNASLRRARPARADRAARVPRGGSCFCTYVPHYVALFPRSRQKSRVRGVRPGAPQRRAGAASELVHSVNCVLSRLCHPVNDAGGGSRARQPRGEDNLLNLATGPVYHAAAPMRRLRGAAGPVPP
jgi:hypothetical protein